MEFCMAPFSADYSIEFFVCTDKFCHRCFTERLGYCTPAKGAAPLVLKNQPTCDMHGRPMLFPASTASATWSNTFVPSRIATNLCCEDKTHSRNAESSRVRLLCKPILQLLPRHFQRFRQHACLADHRDKISHPPPTGAERAYEYARPPQRPPPCRCSSPG